MAKSIAQFEKKYKNALQSYMLIWQSYRTQNL